MCGTAHAEAYCTHKASSGPCDANRRFMSKEGSYGTAAEISGIDIGQRTYTHGPWLCSSQVIGKGTYDDPIGWKTFGEDGYAGWRGKSLRNSGYRGRPGRSTRHVMGSTENHPSAAMLPGAGIVIREPGFSFDARPGVSKWASGHFFANLMDEPLREQTRPYTELPPLGQRPGLYGSGRLGH